MESEPEVHALRLRAAVLALKTPQASKRAPAPTSSVFGRAAAAVPADVRPRTTREALSSRFRNVETSALMSGTTMALYVSPDEGPIQPGLMRSLSLLAASNAIVVGLGPEMPRDVAPDRNRPLTMPLRAGDSLYDEWALLVLGPAKRIAFLARRQPDGWDWMITRDQIAVQRAGTAILERVPHLRLRVPALEG